MQHLCPAGYCSQTAFRFLFSYVAKPAVQIKMLWLWAFLQCWECFVTKFLIIDTSERLGMLLRCLMYSLTQMGISVARN